MADLNQYLQGDNFSRHLGIELVEAANGQAVARLAIEEAHLNIHKTVHGAALFALADVALEAASNSHGVVAVSINANISYMKAVSSGLLTATATEVSLTNTLGIYDIKITGQEGELVAVFQGMVYRKRQRIE
ncbi:MAG: PaaI family thioesterase [Chloroflexi bacterium]|nr:PaaI family thioesterase [Chloroflexota bacterium]OJV97817.1 MAG: phenylacetic acid degradation protein [Chloroflexi bacterium 54-19]